MALSKLDVADLVDGPDRVVDRGLTNLVPVAEDVLDDDRGIVDEDADCEDQRAGSWKNSADGTSSGAAPSSPSLSTPSTGRRWFGLLLLGWRESPFVLR